MTSGASVAIMMVKLCVSMHSTNTGPASADIRAGAHNFQRSSLRLIRATTMPPTRVPAMPANPLKVPA